MIEQVLDQQIEKNIKTQILERSKKQFIVHFGPRKSEKRTIENQQLQPYKAETENSREERTARTSKLLEEANYLLETGKQE